MLDINLACHCKLICTSVLTAHDGVLSNLPASLQFYAVNTRSPWDLLGRMGVLGGRHELGGTHRVQHCCLLDACPTTHDELLKVSSVPHDLQQQQASEGMPGTVLASLLPPISSAASEASSPVPMFQLTGMIACQCSCICNTPESTHHHHCQYLPPIPTAVRAPPQVPPTSSRPPAPLCQEIQYQHSCCILKLLPRPNMVNQLSGHPHYHYIMPLQQHEQLPWPW